MESFLCEILENKISIAESKCSHLRDAQDELVACTNVLDRRLDKISANVQELGKEKKAMAKLNELKKRVQNVNKMLTSSLKRLENANAKLNNENS